MAQLSGDQGGGAWAKLRSWPLLGIAISLVIILVGSALASWVQSDMGTTQVREVTYAGTNGTVNDAYLFIPNGVNDQNPAPGVLAVHGFNNSKEYMNNTALELARRGYVVLNIDMEDHGHSDQASSTSGDGATGAIDGFNYLYSLSFVDKNKIGGVGMSMGGMVIDVAGAKLTFIKSLFFMDSSCTATCDSKINEAIGVGLGTEFSGLFVHGEPGIDTGAKYPTSTFIQKWAGTTTDVVWGQQYGSVADGTARILYDHWGSHPLSTDDPTTIGQVISWFGLTLGGQTNTDLIYPFKMLGTGLGFLGLVLFIFAFGGWLLKTRVFAGLNESVPEYKGNTGALWWAFAIITTLLGPVTFNWAFNTGLDDNWFHLEGVSTGFAFWMFVVGVIAVVILAVGYFALGRSGGASLKSYGLTWEGVGFDWGKIAKAAGLALTIIGVSYFILWVADSWLQVDFRFFLLTLKTSDFGHFPMMVIYAIPIGLYFLATAVVLHGTLRARNGQASLAREMITNMLVLVIGAALLLAWYYGPAEFLGWPPNQDIGMGMINFVALIVLLPVLAGWMTYFFRKTGHVYVGAFLCTAFISWYLTAAMTTYIAF